MIDKKKNTLSLANFKNPVTGELVDIQTLSDEDKIDFYLASLMKKVIETLEMAITNDRVFSRSKFQIMADFHDEQNNIHGRHQGANTT